MLQPLSTFRPGQYEIEPPEPQDGHQRHHRHQHPLQAHGIENAKVPEEGVGGKVGQETAQDQPPLFSGRLPANDHIKHSQHQQAVKHRPDNVEKLIGKVD